MKVCSMVAYRPDTLAVGVLEPKTYSKKLGELISAVPFFPRGELIPTSKLIRILRVPIRSAAPNRSANRKNSVETYS